MAVWLPLLRLRLRLSALHLGSRPVDDLIVTPPSKDSLGSKEEMQSKLEDDIAKVQAKAQAKVQAGIAQPAWEDEITACLAAALECQT